MIPSVRFSTLLNRSTAATTSVSNRCSLLSSRLGATTPRPTSFAISTTNRLGLRLNHHTTKVVDRELPSAPTKSRRPWYIGGAIVGTLVWVVGLSSALNYQRLSSSVVSGTLFMVRYDPRVIELVGDKVDYADSWPWISGTVNHLKGKVNIAFDVTGSKGERARVRFSSQRRGHAWHTLEFTVTRQSDDETVDIGHHELTDQGAPFALEHLE